jgi:hypothetical protein
VSVERAEKGRESDVAMRPSRDHHAGQHRSEEGIDQKVNSVTLKGRKRKRLG